jgi:hypothetical protein
MGTTASSASLNNADLLRLSVMGDVLAFDSVALEIDSSASAASKTQPMRTELYCNYCGGPQDLHADYCIYYRCPFSLCLFQWLLLFDCFPPFISKKSKNKDGEMSSEDASLMQGIVDDANVRVFFFRFPQVFLSRLFTVC